jgi:hypothetical protein
VLSPAHQDNLFRWHSDQKGGFYESHFIKVNVPQENAAFWWKFTVLQPISGTGPARFDVWAIFFDISNPALSCALKETFSSTEAWIVRDRLECRYGQNILEHGRTQGVLNGERPVEWSVSWETPTVGFRHFPSQRYYTGAFPKTKVVSPVLSSQFRGVAKVGDRKIVLDGARGMQGHNWGSKHADSWAWVHCNLFQEDAHTVFEGVTSRVKVGPLRTPQLTILHLDDGRSDPITVNGIINAVRTSSEVEGLCWRFRGVDGNRALQGVFSAPPERFVGVDYEDPDGTITHCLNSKIADGEVRVLHRDTGVWRLKTAYSTRAGAALEIGTKQETHGVQIHLA